MAEEILRIIEKARFCQKLALVSRTGPRDIENERDSCTSTEQHAIKNQAHLTFLISENRTAVVILKKRVHADRPLCAVISTVRLSR